MNFGEKRGQLVVIVDILDQNRVLVDGPTNGINRLVINVKRIALTKMTIDIKRGEAKENVASKYKEADIDGKFAASGWGKKLERKKRRAALDDFGRFKVMCARMKKSRQVSAALKKVKA